MRRKKSPLWIREIGWHTKKKRTESSPKVDGSSNGIVDLTKELYRISAVFFADLP
jgi:hypothetical protein